MFDYKKYLKYLSNHTSFYIIGCSALSIFIIFSLIKSLAINEQEHQNYQLLLEDQIHRLILLEKDVIGLYNASLDQEILSEEINSEYQTEKEILSHKPKINDRSTASHLEDKIQQYLLQREKENQLIIELQQKQKQKQLAWKSLFFVSQQIPRDQNITEQQIEIVNSIDKIIDDLITYQLNPNDFLLNKITYRKKQLHNIEQNKFSVNDTLLVQQVIVYIDDIIESQPQIETIIKQLDSFSTLSKLELIKKTYLKYYINNLSQVYKYRLQGSLALLILLIWTSYKIIINLKKTNNQIVKILENFTAELEDKVEERTSQLEKSVAKTAMALSRAKEANEAKSRFLANMSHELRTPLNAILGFSQLMSRDLSLSASNKESLEIINRSGEHLLKLINDILEMSKIEAGRVTLEENEFDFFLLLRSIEKMFQLKAKMKNLKLTFIKDPAVPQFIKADKGKLRQIIINILGNAIKFTEKGQVCLRVNLEKKQVQDLDSLFSDVYCICCEIEDTGPGIEAENIDKLFTPFEQTKSGRISQEGTGLGLSICQKFIELMGGEITVESTVGKGTIFRFNTLVTLVTPNSIESHQYKKVISLAPNQPSYRILAVDDRPESRLLLRQMLSNIGFEVNEASNGQEAIDLWKSWQPHLIFMDMQMPVIDGYEATKKIKSYPEGEETIIIALTASVFEEEKILILSAGCNDFMRKPFYEGELFDKISYHLGVDFIYEDELETKKQDQAISTQEPDNSELTPADMDIMPESWQLQLYQAAEQVDNFRIYELIAEIPAEYTFIREKLTNLVKHFRCDTIIDLIEPTKVTK